LLKAADETTRNAYPVTINRKRIRRQPLPIWRSAQGTMGRYFSAGEFRDGRRRSLIARRLHTTILERSDLGWRTRSETTTNVWSEADGKGGYLYPTSPPSRPSSALKEKINPSQKRRYMAKSRAPGS